MTDASRSAPSGGSTFQFPVRVYWEDTDAGDVVFYANYLKYFERARTEWLRSLGIEQRKLKAEANGMFVVSDTQVRYLRPARLDDALIVTASVQQLGRASMVIAQQVLRFSEHPSAYSRWQSGDLAENLLESSPEILCEGNIRIGWVNATSLQPARIPAHILEALQ